jgi:hypothetical protein
VPFADVADALLAGDAVGELVAEVDWLSMDCRSVENC